MSMSKHEHTLALKAQYENCLKNENSLSQYYTLFMCICINIIVVVVIDIIMILHKYQEIATICKSKKPTATERSWE